MQRAQTTIRAAELAPPPEHLLTPSEVAGELRVTEERLAMWRATKKAELPFLKIGKDVRYRRADLDRFLQNCRVAA